MFLDLLQAPQGPGEAGAVVGREISGPLGIIETYHSCYSIRPLPGGAGHCPSALLCLEFPSLSHQPHILHSMDFELEEGQGAELNPPVPIPAPTTTHSSSPPAQEEFLLPSPHHVTYKLSSPTP